MGSTELTHGVTMVSLGLSGGQTWNSPPELGHGTTGQGLMAGVEQLPLGHLPTHPSALLVSCKPSLENKAAFFQPDPRPVLTLLTCPWQPYISAPSDANPISLFSCLIPRQCVALSSLGPN